MRRLWAMGAAAMLTPGLVRAVASGLALGVALAAAPGVARDADDDDAQPTPTGIAITPLAAPGARLNWLGTLDGTPQSPRISNPAALAASPDGALVALLTSGFNGMALPDGKTDRVHSTERLQLWRPASGSGSEGATKIAEAPLLATFAGLAWSPDGKQIAVTMGVGDAVQLFDWDGATLAPNGPPISLGHAAGLGLRVKPAASGIAWAGPNKVLVTNFFNDSVSLVDTATRKVLSEIDLRPGKLNPADRGKPGGTYPFRVVVAGPGRAVVSSPRDRELITLSFDGDKLALVARAPTMAQPTALLALPGGRVVATGDNSDTLIALAADGRTVSEYPLAVLPAGAAGNLARPKGLNPNALALAQGGRLWVSLGGVNAVAAIDVAATLAQASGKPARLLGLAPTGWYPDAIAFAGGRMAVANYKGLPGPNGGACRDGFGTAPADEVRCRTTGRYILQRQTGSLLTLPEPGGATLARLTARVRANIGAPSPARIKAAEAVMAAMRGRIKNVIYIVKENRTYDQVLGDLKPGNGDPRYNLFPEALSPNHHQLARQFVTFDNFHDSGEVSATGWSWSTQARAVDLLERLTTVGYASKGLAYEAEGGNRFVNVALPAGAARHAANPDVPDDVDLLAGTADLTATDTPGGEAGAGTLWATAMAKGLSVRNYGFYGDLSRYEREAGANRIPLERDPRAKGLRVMWAQDKRLDPVTDPYFRSFDQAFPDYWLVEEWKRDWLPLAAAGKTPRLTLLRLAHDHFGDFAEAIDGVNTPDRQFADNDYAIGRVAEALAASPAGRDTLIAIVEDDAQNGGDHVDARRSIAYLIGPGVRRGKLVSTRYTTVNLLKTMERLLDLPPLGLNDSLALPMADAFDPKLTSRWTYKARWPQPLDATALPKPAARVAMARPKSLHPERSAAWWQAAMAGQDFSGEDKLDTANFNAALWKGLKGATPQPGGR